MSNGSALRHHSDGQLRNRGWDRAVAELAARQHGVVSRAQLGEIGLGRGAVDLRIARSRLHRIHRGVYAVGHSTLTDRGRWMAAVLAVGDDAVLSHRPGAALWGIRPSSVRGAELTTRKKLHSRPGLRFHHSHLPTDETTTCDRIQVTTVPRTLFDLAGVIPQHQLARAVNEAEIRHLWDPLSLADLLGRHPRRPGAAAIRALVDEPGRGFTRSDLEDRFIDFLDEANLPRPATNLPLRIAGRWLEPDCVWRDRRLIVELDSHTYHGTSASFESDRARDRALTVAGWRVIRVTWRQLHDDPEALIGDLRAALRSPAVRSALDQTIG